MSDQINPLKSSILYHKNLGVVEIDINCIALNFENPDASSCFVYDKQEEMLKEVSISMLENQIIL